MAAFHNSLLYPSRRRTDCCELAPDVNDHDHQHDQSNDMRKSSGTLEDDRVCQLNRSRVALRLSEV
jgi:hypothetical protein